MLHCSIIHTSTSYAINSLREFTRKVSLQKNSHCQIVVDSHLRVLGDTIGRVYALGECIQGGSLTALHGQSSLCGCGK